MAYLDEDKGRLREGESGAHVASVASADAVAAAGAAPDDDEFDAVVTLANETKAQLNALLVSLRAAGVLKTS